MKKEGERGEGNFDDSPEAAEIQKEYRSILLRYGHEDIRTNENVGDIKKIAFTKNHLEHLASLCKELSKKRDRPDSPVPAELLGGVVEAGLTDFSGIFFSSFCRLKDKSLRGLNFNRATFNHVAFSKCDFTGSSFLECDCSYSRFENCVLDKTDFSCISVQGEIVDLRKNEVVVSSESMWEIRQIRNGDRGTCPKAESFFESIFSPFEVWDDTENPWYGCGLFLTQEGRRIGVIKYAGEVIFLPFATMVDKFGEVIFWKGGFYGIERGWEKFITDNYAKDVEGPSVEENRQLFASVSIERVIKEGKNAGLPPTIGRKLLRFAATSEFFRSLDEWRSVNVKKRRG